MQYFWGLTQPSTWSTGVSRSQGPRLSGFNYCLPGSFVESPAVSWSLIHQKPIHYCDELLVWAALLSPFIAIQQVHPWRRHILTTSWLQIGHMHFSLLDRSLILFWFFSLAFKYNHNAINDNPIIVKIRNILMPDPIASKNIPNAMNPNPYINIQSRVRRLFFYSMWSPAVTFLIIDLLVFQLNFSSTLPYYG